MRILLFIGLFTAISAFAQDVRVKENVKQINDEQVEQPAEPEKAQPDNNPKESNPKNSNDKVRKP